MGLQGGFFVYIHLFQITLDFFIRILTFAAD